MSSFIDEAIEYHTKIVVLFLIFSDLISVFINTNYWKALKRSCRLPKLLKTSYLSPMFLL